MMIIHVSVKSSNRSTVSKYSSMVFLHSILEIIPKSSYAFKFEFQTFRKTHNNLFAPIKTDCVQSFQTLEERLAINSSTVTFLKKGICINLMLKCLPTFSHFYTQLMKNFKALFFHVLIFLLWFHSGFCKLIRGKWIERTCILIKSNENHPFLRD